jgi:hypothetical protein
MGDGAIGQWFVVVEMDTVVHTGRYAPHSAVSNAQHHWLRRGCDSQLCMRARRYSLLPFLPRQFFQLESHRLLIIELS